MKIKSMLTLACLALIMLLNSCKDDKDVPSPNLEFTFGDESYSLKDGNLFLTQEGFADDAGSANYEYREYAFTNAVFHDGDFEFQDDTYWISIYLVIPAEDDFEPGEYPQDGNWQPFTTKVSYVEANGLGDGVYETEDSLDDFSPVIVRGGVDGGEKMIFEFDGKLMSRKWVAVPGGSQLEETDGSAKFYFQGTVRDVRDEVN